MKTKSLILTMVAVLFTCSNATAQSHIDKIVDELEQKGVDVSKVVKRDPKIKKVVSEIKSLSFYSKDSNYANRLKEAFKKDAENAIQETINNHGNSHNLFFKDGTKSAHYNLSITPISGKDPLVKLSIIIRDEDYNVRGWLDNSGDVSLKELKRHLVVRQKADSVRQAKRAEAIAKQNQKEVNY